MLLLASLAVIVRLTVPPAVSEEALPAIVNLVASPTVTFAVLTTLTAVQVSQTAVTT